MLTWEGYISWRVRDHCLTHLSILNVFCIDLCWGKSSNENLHSILVHLCFFAFETLEFGEGTV